nr:olfactory receptor 141 [Microplitis mediator]
MRNNEKDNLDNIKMFNEKYALQINRWTLKILGIWQFIIESSYFSKIVAVCLMIVCINLLTFVIIPGALFAFVLIKDPALRLRITGALSYIVMGIIKYYYLTTQRYKISDCINHLIYDWKKINEFDDKNIMIDYAKFGRQSSILSAIFMYSSSIIYVIILPFESTGINNKGNVTTLSFVYPCHFIIFNQYESPAYEIVYIMHCSCAFVLASITNATCNLATVFIMHACGQLEIMTLWLNDLVTPENTDKKTYSKYSAIIEQHTKTLRLVEKIKELFQHICFVEVIGCTLNICLLGYYILLEWKNNETGGMTTYLLLLVSFVYNIFLYCYVGELLTEKCQDVSNTVYMSKWYQLPENLARGFVLTLVIAQNYEPIKAGKLVYLSINTFGTIIRTALAYLNILRTFME